MNAGGIGIFMAGATALLGSPGPGIAALLAVGRARGWSGGLRYYAGLQVGLAAALVISGAGLVSLLAAYPGVSRTLVTGATLYLLYLAYAIATSPVGRDKSGKSASFSPYAGALLGITNPKAYLAIASLLASPPRLAIGENVNIGLKISLCMAVIVVVDIVWLWVGVSVGRAKLTPLTERMMNIVMGATIVAATAFSL